MKSALKSIRLTFTEGTSDKEYNLQLLREEGGYRVLFQYGRRNGTLQSGTKTASPVTLEAAEKIYEKLVKEKTSKGYIPEGESLSSYQAPVGKEESGLIPQLLNPITDQELQSLLNDPDYVFQKKHDGERRLIFKSKSQCFGGNRKGQKVSLPNEIEESISNEDDLILDGEIIGTTLYAFDVIRHNGKDYKNSPLSERVQVLESLDLGESVVISKTAFSPKEKRALLSSLKKEGAEGVVAKKVNSAYTSSRPASGGPALKFKFYKTATVKVSAITEKKRSVQVSVLDGDNFIDVGAVTIPPNHNVPNAGELVEVRYLYAYRGGSLYQPTYLGVRKDLDENEAVISQLEYKAT
jgi:bifunctional non-homologous end joining protein LigD